jgi:hypothetical protein
LYSPPESSSTNWSILLESLEESHGVLIGGEEFVRAKTG